MPKWLLKLASLINRLNEQAGKAVSWLAAVLVALVCFDVIARYLLSSTAAWIMELEWHLFSLLFLLGAGYAFKHGRHVRVDLFYSNYSERDKAWTDLFGGLLFLLPWCFLLGFYAYDYALISFKVREGSPDPGGLPARYLIKFSIVLGMALLFLQGLANIIESAAVLRGQQESNNKP